MQPQEVLKTNGVFSAEQEFDSWDDPLAGLDTDFHSSQNGNKLQKAPPALQDSSLQGSLLRNIHSHESLYEVVIVVDKSQTLMHWISHKSISIFASRISSMYYHKVRNLMRAVMKLQCLWSKSAHALSGLDVHVLPHVSICSVWWRYPYSTIFYLSLKMLEE